MSEFTDRWGHLTVAEALELNKAAQRTCEWETTSCGEK